MKEINLYQHQKEFLMQNPDKSALVWSCGTGKTRTAIEWAGKGLEKGFDTHVLVICPKALKTNWQREAKKWGKDFSIQITSKEEFRKNCNNTLQDKKVIWIPNHVIVDEVHNGFLTPQFKSQMSKALRNYLKKHNVPRVLLLSATVYTSSPWNIYNLAYYLGHKWNYRDFSFKFFSQVRMGMRIIPVARKGCEKELAKLTKKIASVVDIADCMDVPEQLHCEPEYFALTSEQKKAIKDNYDPVPIVRFTKQHEIENGILIGDEFKKSQIYETDKIERLKTLCEENKKVAIVARYNSQIDSIKQKLTEIFGNTIRVIRGDTKDRDRVCVEAEQAEEAIVIIQSDCGVGFQLPSFGLCVYVSMSYSYTAWEQMNGRFLRMDKPSRTTFMYLLTDGDSIDQAVFDSVKKKEDFKIALFAKRNTQ